MKQDTTTNKGSTSPETPKGAPDFIKGGEALESECVSNDASVTSNNKVARFFKKLLNAYVTCVVTAGDYLFGEKNPLVGTFVKETKVYKKLFATSQEMCVNYQGIIKTMKEKDETRVKYIQTLEGINASNQKYIKNIEEIQKSRQQDISNLTDYYLVKDYLWNVGTCTNLGTAGTLMKKAAISKCKALRCINAMFVTELKKTCSIGKAAEYVLRYFEDHTKEASIPPSLADKFEADLDVGFKAIEKIDLSNIANWFGADLPADNTPISEVKQ